MIVKWLVCITGGIAAYKIPELIRLLRKKGCEVRVVLSSGAKAFVAPMALQAVSGHPVYSELFDADFEAGMGHIELARWCEGVLVAPLSANRLAALALGLADDLLTTLCLATTSPIWVAPAMNQQMWHHAATQQNIEILKERGVNILGPDWGEQACKEVGLGRMLAPIEIVNQLEINTMPPLLQGRHVLITAGPTQEALDPVRYLSNRSSGKMGFALAKAALILGATVTLISGPVALTPPKGVTYIQVVSAQDMQVAVMAHYAKADIFISTAAVADFRPEKSFTQKYKKRSKEEKWELVLVPNPDILAMVAQKKDRPFCVGFAAETEHLAEHAGQKLAEKNVDLIAGNDVSRAEIGFDSEENALTVLSQEQTYIIPKANKESIAFALLKIISENYAKSKIKNT